MKLIFCTFISVILLGGSVFAGTVSTLRDVGFSDNGRYFAFTTTEDNGMSDLTCRTTTFINTVRNEWIGRPYRVCQFSETALGSVKARNIMRKRSTRARHEISRLTKKLKINFKNNGQRVMSRNAFRYWKNSGSVDKEFSKKGESVTFVAKGKNHYRLRLSKKTVTSAKCKGMMYNHPPAVMSLRMRNLGSNQSTPLQVDRGIPKTRGCPYHYRIQHLYTHKRGRGSVIVALLQYFSPSIEGPDERYIAVSGRMN